ncbi:MAG: hypothetical protein M0P46_09075 [Thiopseudomonas sp.]|nr:hypothetical protein [Thiopseudomonas sp.]
MIPQVHSASSSEPLALFREYAARVRRDRRLSGADVCTLTLTSQLESQDSVTLDARFAQGRLIELGYRVRACSLTQATTGILAARAQQLSASMLRRARQDLERVLAPTPPEPSTLIWPELSVLQDAAGMPDRHQVIFLPFEALQQLFATEEEHSD